MLDVLFINSTEEFALRSEANGTMLLATELIRAGFKTKILRFAQIEGYKKNYSAFLENAVQRVLELSPKCVSFYTLWAYYHIMLRMASEIKKKAPEITIVFGGPQSTFTADLTMQSMGFVDFVCTGEGEHTVVPFFSAVIGKDAAAIKEIPGLYYRKDGQIFKNELEAPLADLEDLPRWDDSLWINDYSESSEHLRSKSYNMPINVGRGCPYKCAFCPTSSFLHRSYRLKSAKRIVEDIKYYHDRFGMTAFWFTHDAFTVNREKTIEICDEIIKQGLNITWKCTSRIDRVDEELLLKMKAAGMTMLEFGIETASPVMQKKLNKNLDLTSAFEKVDFILKNGIDVNLFFMFGFPEETEEDIRLTVDMALNMYDRGATYINLALCLFFPGSALTDKYYDELIFDEEFKSTSRGLSFAYDAELDVIKQNKGIFPFLYNLRTPLRKKYEFLQYFAALYGKLRRPFKQLRSVYNGDGAQMYCDFCSVNADVFEKDIAEIEDHLFNRPLDMIERFIDSLDLPNAKQLKALFKFECDIKRIFDSKKDAELDAVYDFSYYDFKLGLPIEKYSEGQSEIHLQKKNGKSGIKVIRIV